MKILSNVVADFNDENNFPHKYILTNAQASRHCKAFVNNPSANIKSLKTQLYKIDQSEWFLGRLLGPLLGNSLKQ